MIRTTREQRETLWRKCYEQNHGRRQCGESALTYREFRGMVEQGWGCIMVPFKGDMLGIEPNGYAHT